MSERTYKIAHAIWAAWSELNAIRARDGVPYTHQGYKADVASDYFSEVVDGCEAAYKLLTGMEIQPWAPNADDLQ